MTEEARKTAKAMHQNECEDCVFNPTKLGCRWRKKGMYCDTALHSAADLIESLSEQLEQVTNERDGLNILLAQAQAMLETRTKERDAAAEILAGNCDACNKEHCKDCRWFDDMTRQDRTLKDNWKWCGVEVTNDAKKGSDAKS